MSMNIPTKNPQKHPSHKQKTFPENMAISSLRKIGNMRQNIPCVSKVSPFGNLKPMDWGHSQNAGPQSTDWGHSQKVGPELTTTSSQALHFGNAHTLGPFTLQFNPNYIQYSSQGDDFLLTFLWTQNPNVLDQLPLEKRQGKRKEKKIARQLFGRYRRSLTLAWSIS